MPTGLDVMGKMAERLQMLKSKVYDKGKYYLNLLKKSSTFKFLMND